MKKLIFLLILIVAIGVNLNAQNYTSKIALGNSYSYVEASKVLTNADSCVVYFNVETNNPFTLDGGVNIDFTSGTQTATVYLEGRKASDQTWTAIANQACGSLTNTTTISSHTTAIRYRQIKVKVKSFGTGICSTDNVWLKIWNQ